MDIMNELTPERFEQVDDLLAFVSIYDDDKRTHSFTKLLKQHKRVIKDAVCVEAGCGFGLFSEFMALLGAGKVYAVEQNPLLFQQAKERLSKYDNVEIIQSDIRDFMPKEHVNVLVQELFGQLLYDENICVLNNLKFTPDLILPNHAILAGGCINSNELIDDTVTENVIKELDGCLVSGLFDDEDILLDFPVAEWKAGKVKYSFTKDISNYKGDMLYLGLQVLNENKIFCQAGECDNWSYVWTPRNGDVFTLEFEPTSRGMETYFYWNQ